MDLDSGSERSGVFDVACSNTVPPFEKKESILNEMVVPELIKNRTGIRRWQNLYR